jgi:hypothetical protein
VGSNSSILKIEAGIFRQGKNEKEKMEGDFVSILK